MFQRYFQVFALYIPSILSINEAYTHAKNLYSVYKEEVCRYMPQIGNSLSFKIMDRGSILSIENAHCFINDEDSVSEFYEMGVRIISLTHNEDNRYACGCKTKNDIGLTQLGKRLIKQLLKRGIIIDVSHLSFKSFWDIIDNIDKGLMATHSCSYTIKNHERNLTDDMFREIKMRNGFVGLNIYPEFIGGDRCGIDNIINHIEHFLNLGGENTIGLGCDFDGVDKLPEGITGINDISKLADRMLQKNFSDKTVRDIFYNNGVNFIRNHIN